MQGPHMKVQCLSRIETLDKILRSTLLYHRQIGDLKDKIAFLKENKLFPQERSDEEILKEPYLGEYIKKYKDYHSGLASVIDSSETFPSQTEYKTIDMMFDEGFTFCDYNKGSNQRTRQNTFIKIAFSDDILEIYHSSERLQTIIEKPSDNFNNQTQPQEKPKIRIISQSESMSQQDPRNLGPPPPLITHPQKQIQAQERPDKIKFNTVQPQQNPTLEDKITNRFQTVSAKANPTKILIDHIHHEQSEDLPLTIVEKQPQISIQSGVVKVPNRMEETCNFTTNCNICFDQLDEIVALPCNHQTHLTCQIQEWKTKYDNSKRNLTDFTCLECQKPVGLDILRHYIPQEFIQNIQNESATKIGNTHCPYGCGAVFIIDPSKTVVTSFSCLNPSCKQMICAVCKQKYHGEVTKANPCPTVLDQIAMGISGEPFALCPNCFIPFLKDDHCDHVKCTCGMEFCFYCQAPRQPTMDHGNHFHRDGCKYYSAFTDPNEYRPTKCKACKANGKVCEKPESLKTFNSKHKNKYIKK